jgi:hypothetical protein
VSYLRYTPDVSPPPAELATPPRSRAVRWVIGTGIYLILLILWTWWMTLPPPIEPPLAIIPLPDGSELRLVHAVRGESFTMRDNDTYGGRISRAAGLGRSSSSMTAPAGTTWLVWTRFFPGAEAFSDPALEGVSIVEGTPPHPHRGREQFGGQRNWLRTQVYLLPAVPARAPTWDLEIIFGGTVVKATIPNPLPAPVVHELSPRPLPQKVTAGDASLTLEKVVLGEGKTNFYTNSSVGSKMTTQSVETATPVFKILYWDLREDAFSFTHSFFDATGHETNWNTTSSEFLPPFSEPAWGLRVRAVQHSASKNTPEKLTAIGDATVPGPGEMVVLPVPPALNAVGITDVLLVGKGTYVLNAKFLTSATPGATPVSPVTVAHPGGFAHEGVNVPSLFVLSTHPQRSPTEDAVFLLREGEKTATCSINSTSSGSQFYFRRIDFNTGDRTGLIPGAKVTLQFLKPKVIEAIFQFPPPPPPAKK